MNHDSLFQNLHKKEVEVISALPYFVWSKDCEDFVVEKKAQVHSTAIIADRVFLGNGTVIGPFVVIEEGVIVGDNCEIRSGALIRSNTIIGNNCVIGHAAEIKHAYIRDDAKIQGHTFVGDSVIGQGARIGTGVVVGNRRFDQREIVWATAEGKLPSGRDKAGILLGDYARLGANVTTNPGTVIGSHSWVAGGQSIGGSVPDKRFVKANGEVVENTFEGDLGKLDQEGAR